MMGSEHCLAYLKLSIEEKLLFIKYLKELNTAYHIILHYRKKNIRFFFFFFFFGRTFSKQKFLGQGSNHATAATQVTAVTPPDP